MILSLAALLGCPKAPPSPTATAWSRVEAHMGTAVQVTILHEDQPLAEAGIAAVFSEFARIEGSMSSWRPDSQLSEVNAAAGHQPVVVDTEIFDLLALSLELAEATDGAFDPTFAALWDVWDFKEDPALPDPKTISQRIELVDWTRVQLDVETRTVFLPEPGMRLGLGAIAKGYATDRSVRILRERGLTDFAVKAGGELYVSGTKSGQPWRVGVRDPRGEGPFAALDLSDAAFDTSGDYERYFEIDGVRYSHIIDPLTGWPATHSCSATVLAQEAVVADAWSTALFVLGSERGMPLIEQADGLEAVLITSDNEVLMSSGMRDRLWVFHPPTD